jgi:hypothetical protein
MNTMKAVVYDEPGKFDVRELPVPELGRERYSSESSLLVYAVRISICTLANSDPPIR